MITEAAMKIVLVSEVQLVLLFETTGDKEENFISLQTLNSS